MANQQQLEILKQGVEVWNKWRKENPKIMIDLMEANLQGVNLVEADFRGANLVKAVLSRANLTGINLNEANLGGAKLGTVKLHSANLSGANLLGASLFEADLAGADLTKASLNGTKLRSASLSHVNLSYTDLGSAYFMFTNLVHVDLSKADGLENVFHYGASTIDMDTIRLSKGDIPDIFLRGCGFTDWEIQSAKLYKPSLNNQEINNIIYKIFDLRASQSIQVSPLFISYSHADTPFVEKLETHLLGKGIRFWRDIHNATAGRLETQIDRAMRQNPSVLLVLSENSTTSDWVEHEARLARQLEKEIGKDVLCPIALDDSWESAKWPARLMEQIKEYNILDYSKWNDDNAFEKVFNKMLSGLDMFYKPDKESSK